jgi:hypothetical protein
MSWTLSAAVVLGHAKAENAPAMMPIHRRQPALRHARPFVHSDVGMSGRESLDFVELSGNCDRSEGK